MIQDKAILSGKPFTLHELSEAGYQHVLETALAAFERENGIPGFGYYTFMDRGFDKGIATLLVADHAPEYVAVSAAEASVPRAIDWVVLHNPSIQFSRNAGPEVLDDVFDGLKIVRLRLA